MIDDEKNKDRMNSDLEKFFLQNIDNEEEAKQIIEEDSGFKNMMTSNFLEYASYVIKDRAIPDIDDGFKPVQRRILYSLNCLDDGKFHKVANIVGYTMQFHPHGDVSIFQALVNIANKEYFIEKQGNFGNIITGDNASASRYIECRLSPLAREVLFNKELSNFVDSYDGRNKEPITLPAKIPSLLLQGTEGIAVGMATKILPHNFNEILNSQIALLKNKPICFYPDFLQGGIMDPSQYKSGLGKIILRAKIKILNKKTLIISEIPATTTTESLISSIEDATKNGKIKISKIQDYTGENPEIELQLVRGVEAQKTISALYAYTQCEISISSNVTLINNKKPVEINVNEVLFHNTQMLIYLLHWELKIKLDKFLEKHYEKTLEQIFIENKIYKAIERCATSQLVFEAIYFGFKSYENHLYRQINDDDIERLLKIPIRRISLFDISKMNKNLLVILEDILIVKNDLSDLKKYTINYLKSLIKRYGINYPRRTQISSIAKVDLKIVAFNDIRFGYDKKTGYIGTQVKREFFSCNEFDKIVVIFYDGSFKVINQIDKVYIGRFYRVMKADKNQIYSLVYTDKKTFLSYAKRYKINKFILEKDYRICPEQCKINLLETNLGIMLSAELEKKKRAVITEVEINFNEITLRNFSARGFLVAKRPVSKFLKKRRGSEKLEEKFFRKIDEDIENGKDKVEEDINSWLSPSKISFDLPDYILDKLPVIDENKLAEILKNQ